MANSRELAASRLYQTLKPAERAANEAALRLMEVGTAVLTPRADGTFHPLESQRAVELLGAATANAFEAISNIGRMHRHLGASARRLGLETSEGVIFDTPPADTPRGNAAPALEQLQPVHLRSVV